VGLNPGLDVGETAGAGVAFGLALGDVVDAAVGVAPTVGDLVAALPEQPRTVRAVSSPTRPRDVARGSGRRRSFAGPSPRHVKVRAVRERIVIFWLPGGASCERRPLFPSRGRMP